MARGSAFPTTHGTFLATLVAESAADAGSDAGERARRHVMERYAGPLAVFVRGSSLRRLGEPDELVNGFLVARLSDAAFLAGWAASGMRLRRWLMNGILFYGQGVARDRMRASARGASVDAAELDRRAAGGDDAEIAFERAWALAVVREATARAEEELRDEGRADDFEIFRRHAVDGQPYARIAPELGRSAQQCAGATRLVAQRVRAKLAELFIEEGVPDAELDDEIARVREVLG
ncbi:MAG: hypothetical protein ACKO0W_06195 [Planctomycetota bacterium]